MEGPGLYTGAARASGTNDLRARGWCTGRAKVREPIGKLRGSGDRARASGGAGSGEASRAGTSKVMGRIRLGGEANGPSEKAELGYINIPKHSILGEPFSVCPNLGRIFGTKDCPTSGLSLSLEPFTSVTAINPSHGTLYEDPSCLFAVDPF